MNIIIYENEQDARIIETTVNEILNKTFDITIDICVNDKILNEVIDSVHNIKILKSENTEIYNIANKIKSINHNMFIILYVDETIHILELMQKGYQHSIFYFLTSNTISSSLRNVLQNSQRECETKTVIFYYKGNIYRINVIDILYLYSKGNYVYIATNQTVFKIRDHLRNYRIDKTHPMFLYVDKATIINIEAVSRLDIKNKTVYFQSDICLYISKRGVHEIKKHFK